MAVSAKGNIQLLRQVITTFSPVFTFFSPLEIYKLRTRYSPGWQRSSPQTYDSSTILSKLKRFKL